MDSTNPNNQDDEFSWNSSAVGNNFGSNLYRQQSFAGGLDDLNLNSQATDQNDGVTFTHLLQGEFISEPEEGGAAGRGLVATNVGIQERSSRGGMPVHGGGLGRVPARASAPGGVLARGGGRGGAQARPQQVGSEGGGLRGGSVPVRGAGRGGRPPIPPMSLPYHAPRPTGGRGASASSENEYDTSNWSNENYVAEGDDATGLDASNNDVSFDKAEWTNSENNATFCALCVEQINAGNRSNGFMTGRGYKEIAAKFEQIRGLRHSKTQLKNRWESLKRLFAFWLWLNKQTGLGRSANGGIVASPEFWKLHTKGHAEWRKLKDGPPENLGDLQIMFEHTAVDGSTSCLPGQQIDVEGGDTVGAEEEEHYADDSPISTSTTKRGVPSTTTVTSPKKRIKSPVARIMKGMWQSMEETNGVAQKAMQGQYLKESIGRCMSLVKDCGALAGSAEHHMASKLFVKAEHREVFLTLETNDERMAWLRRWCQDKRVY